MSRDISIYVHIPFCERKCLYCDFLSFGAGKQQIDSYFEALGKEIKAAAAEYKDRVVKTIFFGGGTPSFPEGKKICDTLRAIKAEFEISPQCEISIEVNPASAIYDKLVSFKEAGFNRLSIGAQSLNDDELKKLGRLHDSRTFVETFENARRAGFGNINIDVMSALPDQSLSSYMETLRKVVELAPEHISAYSLIIEDGTPFYDMDLKLPDEDTDRAMYHETKRYLKEHGYHRYEISNYAQPGKECAHNKVYWQRGNYLGLGLGAASMVDNVRWSNTREFRRYVEFYLNNGTKDNMAVKENFEELSLKSQMEEFMFLGLRLVRGVDVEEFRQLFSKDIFEVYGEVIDKYIKSGHLELVTDYDEHQIGSQEGAHLRFTDAGLDVSNTIMADFLL
ncbi:MAG: oxygen-independent coproporphyrinogen III oxidase [Butyrivibrio sp.]|uniref:radical SAM family heme chaperone HemW n=1 Tax=Butyrivibrio sp. TaxID=28121 RepID=UPI001B666AF4|nr:radical SAM family heme chaperone HemW [Butyrivibrio sp.]MBP3781938.1 oxygen-independent coproporphyrinogen III oxidase [Butyrivibrio sp.]MBP3814429.1 oxygen-independent coproporphyrinogen III oxidase [Butyrivibrio sp.]